MKTNLMRSLILCGCIGMALVSCQKQGLLADDLLLSDDWKVQSSAKTTLLGEQLSMPEAEVKGWYDAVVPSTVMGVLTDNGVYSDVLEGGNYKNIDKSLFDTTWWYRKDFEIPHLEEGQHVALMFDGISYAANVWLNGRQIVNRGSLYGPFRRFKLDVTDDVQKKNVLAIEVYRARPGEPNIGFVDWNPRPADENMGIFREVRLVTSNEVAMEHSVVHSKVNTETLDEAWLTVETELTNQSDKAVSGELKGELEGKTFCIPVSLAANETYVVKVTSEQTDVLYLKKPRLWWCHNMGNPEMYKLDLQFVVNNKVSDRETVDFGVREIKDYLTEENARGFLLNGKEVLVRSAGWTDDIFLRDTPESNETQVQYVRDMNLNSIRFENIWGTSQNIYDLCDRYGLLALVGWSCHWEWDSYLGSPCDEYGGIKTEHDMDLIARSLNDQVLWLRNHPSIIAWFVGSDVMPRPELEKRYKAYLDEIDDRPYITAAKEMTSEISGPSGTKMAGPYEYVAPNYWYAREAPGGAFGFNTETGIGAQLPVIESIRKMIPADKLWPLNDVWNYHCTASTTAMNNLDVLTENINARYGEAKDLNDYLRKADLLNYEGTRAMFEAFRVNVPRTTGIVQWMLNSAWPSFYWQLYDHYLVPTAAYYSVKKANRTEQLIYDYGKKAVFAVNEGTEPQHLKGKMAVYDLNGKLLAKEEKDLEALPYKPVEAFKVPVPADNAFLLLQLTDGEGKLLTDNFYCLSATDDVYDWAKSTWYQSPITKPADFTKLASMPQAECKADAALKQEGDSTWVEVKLENAPAAVAFFTRLSLKDAQGELITPVFWEDNYLSLAPGETRMVKCSIPRSVRVSAPVILSVSGWNVAEKNLELGLQKMK